MVALAGLVSACQKTEEHPPFAAGCQKNCPLLPGISVGTGTGNNSGSAGSGSDADGGVGTLQGNVLQLTDGSFVHATLYTTDATVTADGANGTPVTATWHGDVNDPFELDGVARVATSWVSVKPVAVGGDALPTYQAVATNHVTSVDLAMVSSTVLDGIFNAVSTLRSPDSGQVVLFFHSAGTGTPLSGLHVNMPRAQAAAYATTTGWVLDDGTATTNESGLVVFGNVEPANSNGTQTATITRAATGSTPAASAGQFAVKVVQGAVSIATVAVQL